MRTRSRPYYLLRPRLRREPLAMIDLRTMVSRRARYIYVRIPKAANTTVTRALLERWPEPGADAADIEAAKAAVPHLSDLGWLELAGLRRYFVFTVVRDPYARTLSAFLDKFRGGERHLDRFGGRIAELDGGEVTFRGFCRYLAAGGEADNLHWMRQTRILSVLDRIDFIGRVESLDADLATILERIGATAAAPIRRDGPAATRAAERLAEHYDAETREIVARVYRADFEAFGYPA